MENNTEIKSYAGFTIGPIYEVLSSARKTRELWFASYFFSWFMEKIIETLSKNDNIKILTPYVETTFKSNNSVTGKYHDRFILRSYLDKEQLFEVIQKASDDTLEFFAELIDSLVTESARYIDGANIESVRDSLKWYIQRNFVVLDRSAVKEFEVIKSINGHLDSMEENRSFATGINEKTCFVCKILPAVIEADIWVKEGGSISEEKKKKELCPLCFIKHHCFKSDGVKNKIGKKDFKYPSVLDVSAVELLTDEVKAQNPIFKDYEKDYDFEDVKEAIYKTYNKEMADSLLKKAYPKYFAIIQADGDNLGKVFDKLTNFDELVRFSKSLFDFANKAEKIITSYKGYPIYIGGDDILAFTPVAFKGDDWKTKTVIDLAIELSKAYKNIVGENNREATLSIGVNIAYFKFPLSIALKNAREQLFGKAKTDEKNALAFLLTKHSGHQIAFKFNFGSKDIEFFSKLLSKTLGEEIDFPHSMHHNLSRFKELIAYIPDENRLSAFFENNFNEPIHSKYAQGIGEVKNYFKEVMFNVLKEKRLYCVEDILSKLAFIKFLRGEK